MISFRWHDVLIILNKKDTEKTGKIMINFGFDVLIDF